RNPPSNYKRLSKDEITKINRTPRSSPQLALQEQGIRSSCALPYRLFVDGNISRDKQSFDIRFRSSNPEASMDKIQWAGSPFQVYAPGIYQNEAMKAWDYAVA